MRFYIDGDELDVQDPTFFIDEEQYNSYLESIEAMLSLASSSCSNVTGSTQSRHRK